MLGFFSIASVNTNLLISTAVLAHKILRKFASGGRNRGPAKSTTRGSGGGGSKSKAFTKTKNFESSSFDKPFSSEKTKLERPKYEKRKENERVGNKAFKSYSSSDRPTFVKSKKYDNDKPSSSDRPRFRKPEYDSTKVKKVTSSSNSSSQSFSSENQSHSSENSKFKPRQTIKKKAITSLGSAHGRVLLQQETEIKSNKKGPKLCSGCGSEVISGKAVSVSAGLDAAEASTSTKAKHARFVDAVEDFKKTSFLCARCKSLQMGNIFGAYDALRDVTPEVFKEQLKHIVSRRKFGVCLNVIDAADSEFSTVRSLRNIIGALPVFVALNKVDLLPRINDKDITFISRRIQKKIGKFHSLHPVSAHTGGGVLELAEALVSVLGGRDVFVVGSANVGKSSLVKALTTVYANTLYKKGKAGAQRKEALNALKVTTSHLPGTTLQSLRIPCFGNDSHALWDTPGIINLYSLSYSLFSPHLMEPLIKPAPLTVPKPFFVSAGESVLIIAKWMSDTTDTTTTSSSSSSSVSSSISSGSGSSDGGSAIGTVLARLDVLEVSHSDFTRCGDQVKVYAYLPDCLSVQVVPTALAPTAAVVPSAYISQVRTRLLKSSKSTTGADGLPEGGVTLTKQLTIFKEAGTLKPSEDMYLHDSRMLSMDVCFASLGWLQVTHRMSFELLPHVIDTSAWSKRPSMYPINLVQDNTEQDKVWYNNNNSNSNNNSTISTGRGLRTDNRTPNKKGGKSDNKKGIAAAVVNSKTKSASSASNTSANASNNNNHIKTDERSSFSTRSDRTAMIEELIDESVVLRLKQAYEDGTHYVNKRDDFRDKKGYDSASDSRDGREGEKVEMEDLFR